MAGEERGGHKPPYPKNSMERRRKEGGTSPPTPKTPWKEEERREKRRGRGSAPLVEAEERDLELSQWLVGNCHFSY